MQEQLDEANGEQLDTAPSGSGTHPQPVLRTVKKKAPTAVSGAKPATKPAVKPATKSDRIPKLPAAKPKPGLKKVLPQAKKPRNDR